MIRDILTLMDLATWPVVALLLFLGVFLFVVARTMRPSLSDHHDHMNHLPLTDGTASSTEATDG